MEAKLQANSIGTTTHFTVAMANNLFKWFKITLWIWIHWILYETLCNLYTLVQFQFIQFHVNTSNLLVLNEFIFSLQDVVSILNKHVLPMVKEEKQTILESKGAKMAAGKNSYKTFKRQSSSKLVVSANKEQSKIVLFYIFRVRLKWLSEIQDKCFVHIVAKDSSIDKASQLYRSLLCCSF